VICTGPFCDPRSVGGGIFLDEGDLTMRNSIVGCNVCAAGSAYASGLYVDTGVTANLENCTIARNNVDGVWTAGDVTMRNSIVYFNNSSGAQIVLSGAGTLTATYSDIQGGGFPGVGNKNITPAFSGTGCSMTSFEVGDLVIAPGSPCIDVGDPAPQYNDCFFPPSQGSVRNDMGAHGGRLAGPQTCVSRAVSRNGSGVNPVILTNVTAPILNMAWIVDLDCSGRTPPPNLAVLVGVSRPTTGPTIMSGELLVDVFCGIDLLRKTIPHNGGVARFSSPIPNNLALCGLDGYFQGVCFGQPKAILSNALDIRIGSK